MKNARTIALATLLFGSSIGLCATEGRLDHKQYVMKPKLTVVVVIDQFRSDFLTRFEKRFLPAQSGGRIGGFRYLMEKGAYFPFAQYGAMQNITCPGHSTILTGSHPYAHHIPLNDWYDVNLGKSVYCVDDDNAPLVGIDPSKESGVSPRRLQTTTVGDELKSAGFASRVVGIALKDRAAVMLAGHRGDLATWLDTATFQWISSQYYLKDKKLPTWLVELNKKIATRRTTKLKWESKGQGTGLSTATESFSREIVYGSKEALQSPVGVELTTEAALEAVRAYNLGGRGAPDILAVSYSTHDLLGHRVGANSREMEELTVAEDKGLSDLFTGLDKHVPGGMRNVLVILTADHGVAPTVAHSLAGQYDAGVIDSKALMERMNAKLNEKFNKPAKGQWIEKAQTLNFYLNRAALADRKLEMKVVADELKALLEKEKGVEWVFTLSDYRTGQLPPGRHLTQIRNTFVPERNGDVVIIPQPFFQEEGPPATHMTGYSYDSSVPVIFAGHHFKPGVYSQAAQVVDIAPTLSFILGVLPPAANDGRVLSEAIGR